MRKIIMTIVALVALGGCSNLTGGSSGPTPNEIAQCAKKNPPPPQANVERLGLIPVYFTRTAGSDDAETKQWFTDMDTCLGKPTK